MNHGINHRFLQWMTQLAVVSVTMVSTQVMLSAHAQAAEEFKIGFVNTERILREATLAKQGQQRIEQEFSKRNDELKKMEDRLKQLQTKLEKDAPVINDAERNRRQREMTDIDREFQRKQREFQEDLNQRRNEEFAQLLEKGNKAIKQLAETEKYDIIFQEAVYASPRIDVTERVLKTLNATAPK
jgi:outer membrane protein